MLVLAESCDFCDNCKYIMSRSIIATNYYTYTGQWQNCTFLVSIELIYGRSSDTKHQSGNHWTLIQFSSEPESVQTSLRLSWRLETNPEHSSAVPPVLSGLFPGNKSRLLLGWQIYSCKLQALSGSFGLALTDIHFSFYTPTSVQYSRAQLSTVK